MKKELTYLSLPDYFNKFNLINFNQKFSLKNSIILEFKFSNKNHLGLSLKSIYFLEILFPRKSFVLKIILKKKKKIYFGQKNKNNVLFSFNLNISSIQFIELFRYFLIKPLKMNKSQLEEILIVNKKLKQFEFNNKILLLNTKLSLSSFNLQLYHLN